MAYETIILDISDHVATIRLNRPDALNALNKQMVAELGAAIVEIEKNDKVRCTLLTGSDKVFAAGADVTELVDQGFVDIFSSNWFADDLAKLERARKPIIAVVSGYALGGGCELAMMCDFIICSDTAKFGQPEINLGVMAGIGGTQRLTRLIGRSKAMDMHLTGRQMLADEAERSGLVSRVFPNKKLMEEANAIAHRIVENSMVATMAAKEAVKRAEETSLSEGILFERRMFHALFATEDKTEGMGAFVAKREPQFRDK